MFSCKEMKPKDVFEILKDELTQVFSNETSYRITSSKQLELIDARDWGVEEMDGKNYTSQFLLILAHENSNIDSFGTYFVIKATPFNCYYGEAKNNSLKTVVGLESIQNKKVEHLTKFYREQMAEFWGKDRYKIDFLSYITRAKLYQKNKAEQEYKNKLNNINNELDKDERIF